MPFILSGGVKSIVQTKEKIRKARAFQDKLASLKFLDPACGSGNFLTETFLSLRRLENEVIRLLSNDNMIIGFEDDNSWIKVGIHQFYGIEINDFAVATATTALWIAEAQMMKETENIIQREMDFFPLKSYTNIVEGNALRMDWNEVIPASELNYIMGNPPFVGARMMTETQKQDLFDVFGVDWANAGNLDYVCCWYKKATDLMDGSSIRTAFVSTNTICQGEQVANLWERLYNSGVHIDFAHRTFRWDSEANLKAHVHCIIVGFSRCNVKSPKLIFEGESVIEAKNINAYLIDGPNIFIGSRNAPLSSVPMLGIGNKPVDGGNYLFTKEEMEDFIRLEPLSAQYFRPFYGAVEFIHQKPRYCLWLGQCSPAQLRTMPNCLKRVEAVRAFRLASKSEGTRKLADRPTRFHVENMPVESCIVIPQVSSQNRQYIPMGYMNADVLCSDKVRLMPEGTIYHFGILNSNVHMAWVRVVSGRLKSDYSYTVNNVYNNFPWPTPTEAQKAKIEKTAQAILDARNLYPDCSLADLYDEVTMPPELRKAHQDNDKAVMEAYGFNPRTMTEPEIVAELFKLYQNLLNS